ncbi:hypothetical protein BDR22DRAFT_370756 [Usnea florida]
MSTLQKWEKARMVVPNVLTLCFVNTLYIPSQPLRLRLKKIWIQNFPPYSLPLRTPIRPHPKNHFKTPSQPTNQPSKTPPPSPASTPSIYVPIYIYIANTLHPFLPSSLLPFLPFILPPFHLRSSLPPTSHPPHPPTVNKYLSPTNSFPHLSFPSLFSLSFSISILYPHVHPRAHPKPIPILYREREREKKIRCKKIALIGGESIWFPPPLPPPGEEIFFADEMK